MASPLQLAGGVWMKKALPIAIAGLIAAILAASCAPSSLSPSDSPTASPESTSQQTSQPSPSSERVQATVTRVIDGDTIEVSIAGSTYSVRYIGVDTPEVGQPGADEATQVNAQLVEGRTVELEKDVSETDKYGRLLRYVWIDDQMVNALLVYNGYAQVATYPPDVRHQDYFLDLQRQAEAESSGLWSATEDTTPSPTQSSVSYFGSRNSDVYHYSSCRYVGQILSKNLVSFSSSANARASGYRPCKVCRPP